MVKRRTGSAWRADGKQTAVENGRDKRNRGAKQKDGYGQRPERVGRAAEQGRAYNRDSAQGEQGESLHGQRAARMGESPHGQRSA